MLVDHTILLDKLKHHVVGEASITLVKSFLSGCKLFVEVQGSKYAIKSLGDVSVIQGSKNASFLYTAYNIEVVYLPRVMRDAAFFQENHW